MSIAFRPLPRFLATLLAGAALAAAGPACGQQNPPKAGQAAAQTSPAPAPIESQPLPPLAPQMPAPDQTAPAAAPAPAPASPVTLPATGPAPTPLAPGSAAPAAGQAGGTTLAPPPADPSVPDTVDIAGRPAASLKAQSTWDDGYDTLIKAFQHLQEAMDKAGIKVTGRPLTVFIETDDVGFRFEAQLPIEAAPASRPAGLVPEIGFATTPSGRAIRFVHHAPYDDIDSTYEAISAYLDSKGIEVKDSFTEEYVNSGTNAGDPALELNIYVLPKE